MRNVVEWNRIVFSVSIDQDGDCVFDVTVTKGTIAAHMHFYGDAETWLGFGKQLLDFPQHIAANVSVELGANGQYMDFWVMQAYCYDMAGHTALRIVTDNNDDDPHRCRLEFSIPAEVASLNNLGRLLSGWQVEDGSEIIWSAQTS